MINEENVDRRASGGPDHRHSLGGSFLRHGSAEAIRNLCDEPYDSRRALRGPASYRKVSRRVGYRRGKGRANREIPDLAPIVRRG
jgi:hypothetical protein